MSQPINRQAIVAHARTYLGTPYIDEGRTPGVGLDCLGILLALTRELAIRDIDVAPYGTQIDQQRFRRDTREHAEQITFAELMPADFLTFDIAGREQHYGLVTELGPPIRFIHTYRAIGRVIEVELGPIWLRRLRGCYRLRDLAQPSSETRP